MRPSLEERAPNLGVGSEDDISVLPYIAGDTALSPPAHAAGGAPESSATRVDAIARLRRAATQREVRRISPRRLRVRQADVAPKLVQAQPPMLAAPLAEERAAAVAAEASAPARADPPAERSGRSAPQEPRAVARAAPRAPPAMRTAPERSPLPSLDELRRRILEERKSSGLSRSASTSAASQVARAYAMQKLMGATNPVPNADMLALVRGVNAARSADEEAEVRRSSDHSSSTSGSANVRHSRTLGVADESLYLATQAQAPPTDEAPSPPPEVRKRATLMRSVSARDVARNHMFRKLRRPAGSPAHGDPAEESPAGRAAPSRPATPPSGPATPPHTAASGPAATPTGPPAQAEPVPAPALVTPEHVRVLRSGVSAFSDDSSSNSPTLASTQATPGSLQSRSAASGSPRLSAALPGGPVGPLTPSRVRAEPPVRAALGETPSRRAPPVRSPSSARPREKPLPQLPGVGGPPHAPAAAPELGPAPPGPAPQAPLSTGLGIHFGSPATPGTPGTLADSLYPPGMADASRPGDEALAAAEAAQAARRRAPARFISEGHTPIHADASPPEEAPAFAAPRSPVAPAALGAERAPEPAYDNKKLAPFPGLYRRGSSGGDDPQGAPPRREGRGARLLGSLRRKTSRARLPSEARAQPDGVRSVSAPSTAPQGGARANGAGARTRHAKQASDASGATRAFVTLAGARTPGAGGAARSVVLSAAPRALVRWNATLTEPFADVLGMFPCEMSQRAALEPPRRLLRVVPILQSVDEAYVKLRYLFLFEDVVVLAKPTQVAGDVRHSVSEFMLRKLGSVPDLEETFHVLDVLDLHTTQLLASADMGEARDAELRRSMLRYEPNFVHDALASVHAGAAHAAHSGGATPETLARCLYVCPELDRAALSRLLFRAPAQRALLEAYVGCHPFAGVPLDAALRMLLLDVHFPTHLSAFEVLLTAFATHWVQQNRAALPSAFSLTLAQQLTFALLALNDALHAGTDGMFAPHAPRTALDTFLARIRAQDVHHVLSDAALHELFIGLRAQPLAQARGAGDPPARAAHLDRASLPVVLVAGVPSAPLTVSLEAPDPDLRIQLHGEQLAFDPPVLTFTHAATATFRVTCSATGTRHIVFVRTGRNAPLYPPAPPTAPLAARAEWVPLPRAVQMRVEPHSHSVRPAFTLTHRALHGQLARYVFSTPDVNATRDLTALLQERIAAGAATAPRLTRVEAQARTLAVRTLQAALLGEEDGAVLGDPARRANPHVPREAAVRTGLDLVRVTREHSLLYVVLVKAAAMRAASGYESPAAGRA